MTKAIIFLKIMIFILNPNLLFSSEFPIEGQHYQIISPANKKAETKIIVDEFFSYACPHCFSFQSIIEPWKRNKPKNVKFMQTPAIFNDKMIPMAKVFYTLQELNALEYYHIAFYRAIHEKRKKLFTKKSIFKWFKDKKNIDYNEWVFGKELEL